MSGYRLWIYSTPAFSYQIAFWFGRMIDTNSLYSAHKCFEYVVPKMAAIWLIS